MATGSLSRRDFTGAAATLLGGLAVTGCVQERIASTGGGASGATAAFLVEAESQRAITNGNRWLAEPPVTITATRAARSPGDAHAYYSEGDYWWPDDANPGGPYIRRDGQSNPDRFDAHRQALIRLSLAVPALTAAWIISQDRRYAEAAEAHLAAWFVTPETRMAPHLNHAQAIIGVNSGRGIGIIDTLHLVEVALAVPRLPLPPLVRSGVTDWFSAYLDWMWTSPNGLDERDEINNHGSCYALQIAGFAKLTSDDTKLRWCRETLQNTLIPNQIAVGGGQPLELARTKPFGYCLFNLDVLAGLAQLIAPGNPRLWTMKGAKGGSLADALAFMAPFIADKTRWPYARDIEYWDAWPVRHPALLIGGKALNIGGYQALWSRLNADPQVPEIIRNFPLRQPLLWL